MCIIHNGVETHIGNLFDLYKEASFRRSEVYKLCDNERVDVIVHGCNAQGRMASGFAKELRARFPGAYDDYMVAHGNGALELGANIIHVNDEHNVIISNSITQNRYGYDGKKYVSYDGIDTCFENLNNMLKQLGNNVHVHYPLIGADLGGGNWNVISEIIESRLNDVHKHLYKLK